VACLYNTRKPLSDGPLASELLLDGGHIDDLTSFFCAIGEAVDGPGGYFGWNLDAFGECLRMRARAGQEVTLHWSHFDVAQRALSVAATASGEAATPST
jgi:hypothetical protein